MSDIKIQWLGSNTKFELRKGSGKVPVKKGEKVTISSECAKNLISSYSGYVKVIEGKIESSIGEALELVVKRIDDLSAKELTGLKGACETALDKADKKAKLLEKDNRTVAKINSDAKEAEEKAKEKELEKAEKAKEKTQNERIAEKKELIAELEELNTEGIEYNIEAMSNEGLKDNIANLKKKNEEIILARKQYEEATNKKVPVNKKNDKEWLQNKAK